MKKLNLSFAARIVHLFEKSIRKEIDDLIQKLEEK